MADGAVTLINFTPFGYISRWFSYWRADIIVRLKFVRTQFHSGRLLFFYQPFVTPSATNAATVADSSYLLRTIIDIRDCNEIEIKIPFVYNRAWADCDGAMNSIGLYQLSVLDPLAAPSNVSSTVNVLIEVRAENVSFAGPRNCNYAPVVPSAFQSGCALLTNVVGGSNETPVDYAVQDLTQGEVIQSFRQLIKRYQLLSTNLVGSTTANMVIPPFLSSYAISTGLAILPSISSSITTRDLYSALAMFYANSSGGVRLLYCFAGATGNTSCVSWLDHVSYDSGALNAIYNYTTEAEAVTVQNHSSLGMNIQSPSSPISVTIPQNTSRLSRINANNFISPTQTLNYSDGADSAQLSIRLMGASTQFYVYRSGADDCSFGNFCSLPPMYSLY